MQPTATSVQANGITFAALEAGSGPLALCLHGFPDTAHTWRHLLPELAAAGFRTVAPFQRGYAPTGLAPDGSYQLGALVADANALHQALGGDDQAVLIGHDWGAMAAYGSAAMSPQRWRRVVTLAVPPAATAGAALFHYEQLRRSFYVFLFQTALAPAVVAADDLAFLERLWRDWSPGYDPAEDLVHVRDALRDPQHLAAAIGYYRALLDPASHRPELAAEQAAAARAPAQPTLYLHGARDGAFGADGVREARRELSPESRVEVLDGVGHFLHLERPDEVGRLVLDWVSG